MGAYDGSKFSKNFSERTEKNYKYILKVVNKDELEKQSRKRFLEKYDQLIDEIETIKEELRTEANQIDIVQKKGKNELKKKIHSIASKLERAKDTLCSEMNNLVSVKDIEGDKLFEVTQLLNSLMGIAVLPYEMHKEYFQNVADKDRSKGNQGCFLNQIQDKARNCVAYDELKELILDYYAKGKWYSSFHRDLTADKKINEDRIVFGFLRHIRNVTCHSGNNALSILPLDDGEIIRFIDFYDRMMKDDGSDLQEFAMCISIEELEKLVLSISKFYRESQMGYIDKTENIKAVEARVDELLKRKKNE